MPTIGNPKTPITYWSVFGALSTGGRDEFCDCIDKETALFIGEALGKFLGVPAGEVS